MNKQEKFWNDLYYTFEDEGLTETFNQRGYEEIEDEEFQKLKNEFLMSQFKFEKYLKSKFETLKIITLYINPFYMNKFNDVYNTSSFLDYPELSIELDIHDVLSNFCSILNSFNLKELNIIIDSGKGIPRIMFNNINEVILDNLIKFFQEKEFYYKGYKLNLDINEM